MKITFHHPPTGTANPFADFTPGNVHHYPDEAGVYIFGLKIPINGIKKFVPLYVGIAQNLRTRLWQHYCEERTGGNSKWYVFDYASVKTRHDVVDLYNSMRIADSKKGLNPARFSPKLVWFNNKIFFDYKLGLSGSSKYISDSGVLASILPNGDIDQIEIKNPLSKAKALKSTIVNSKKLFDDDFYFIYTSLDSDEDVSIEDNGHELYKIFNEYREGRVYIVGRKYGPGKKLAEKIEQTTKQALKQIEIYTCAKAHGSYCVAEINLKEIQNELVNVTDSPYSTSLILKIKKYERPTKTTKRSKI